MEDDEDIWAPTEIEMQRDAWFKQCLKPGMTTKEVFRLNFELIRLFPPTERERRRKTASLMRMPEFIL
jgi:hypothetical protein